MQMASGGRREMKIRYALVGVGSRGYAMFAQPLISEFADVADLVALCDSNPHRLALANQRLGVCIPTYTNFAALLSASQPDIVIVCTPDATHHRFIIAALEAGCDVITEKAMATTAAQVRAILEAEARTGHSVRVSFNARYGAPTETIKRLLDKGVIGRVISADFAEFLNTSHGADYFRRWHRRKENSGGLLIHKATHHFDQLNWWLGADPESVHAYGALCFYGPTREAHSERCLTCPYATRCEFYLDLRANKSLKALYLDAEQHDGYFRDRCVFDPEINIEDTMAVMIRYGNGILVNYALNAFAPYEGQRIGFNGTKGRLELDLVSDYHRPNELGILEVLPIESPLAIRVSPLFGQPYSVPVAWAEGGHGGADAAIRQHLFRPETPDPLRQRAGSRAGAMSALIGVAANESIATGRVVSISELLPEHWPIA